MINNEHILYVYYVLSFLNSLSYFQMNMSPRMPQTQGKMVNHSNNMVGQPSNQGQFMPQQAQFPAVQGGSMNVNVGLGQTLAKASIKQVIRQILMTRAGLVNFFATFTKTGTLFLKPVRTCFQS